MTNYGRNFEIPIPPDRGGRSGKHFIALATPIGAPVKYSGGAETDLGLMPMVLATGPQAPPKTGLGGILVYEYAPAAFAGFDPLLTLYSDLGTTPANVAIQVISDPNAKVRYKNTSARSFLHNRTYTGRVMVAGIVGTTASLQVGDYLTPGVGNDTDGYWAETANAAQAWLVVTKVMNDRDAVEARLQF